MDEKILSDRAFVDEYLIATRDPIPNFFGDTIKFCAYLLLSLSFSFLAVYPIIISMTEDILIFTLILILFSIPLFIISIFTIYESYNEYKQCCFELKQYRYRKELFLAEIGMSMKEATRRYNFILKEAIYVQSLQKICKLNPQTRSGQVEMIKNWYKFKDTALVEYLLDNEYNESDFNMYAGHFEIKNFSEKKSFAELLFKLAILEDGIHDDEWEVLMDLLVNLNFTENYIEFFKKRYNPLRTKFNDYERNTETTKEYHSVSLLKPYYDILGVDENASDEEIKRAYHNLALQHHPDLAKNADRVKESEQMMAKINEAYEKIRN